MTEERPIEPTPPTDETTVTPAPAEAPPAYTPPTSAPPPATPQPTVAWAPPPVTATATGQRTTASLAAGILLTILGVLGGLTALIILTIGREVVRQFDFTNMPGIDANGVDVGAVAGSAVVFVGIVLLAFSTFYIVGGVGIMRSKDWGRVTGIVIGILAGLFWLAGVANGGQARGGGVGFALVLLAIHAYVAIALLFFWRNRAPA